MPLLLSTHRRSKPLLSFLPLTLGALMAFSACGPKKTTGTADPAPAIQADLSEEQELEARLAWLRKHLYNIMWIVNQYKYTFAMHVYVNANYNGVSAAICN